MVASARAAYPNARIDGFLVQEMVSGIEAIVGARTDPIYGPLLLVGAGGILVELAKDAALRLLPVTGDDVRAMIDGLKLSKLLSGYRGTRRRRPRGARNRRCWDWHNSFSITARASTTSKSIR